MDNDMNNNMNMNNSINNMNINNNQTKKEKSLLEKVSHVFVYLELICSIILVLSFILEIAGIYALENIFIIDIFVILIVCNIEFIIIAIGKIKKLFKVKIQLFSTLAALLFLIFLIFLFRVINSALSVSVKPIIYLYPEEETEMEVKLSDPEDITCSYPKYVDGWNVYAKPNGDLTYIQDGKELYSLYYEAENEVSYKVEEDGFVVKSEDVAKFLDEKLEILGLNYKEKEEFIVYWLPRLEANKYNYIRFATIDEINQNMKLEFSKKPDTLIRVLMTYKGLDKEIEVKEQKLETPERKGFVAVEWGGSEIK